MKKVFLSVISFILTCSIMFTFFCVFAFAENNVQAEAKTFDFESNADLISYIENLAASTAPSLGVLTKLKFTVSEVYTLNKFSSSGSYTLFLFEEGGHVVYDNLTETVEELCVEASGISDKFSSGRKYYYAGPGNFIVKQNGNFYDLNTNIQLSTADISAVSALEASVQNARITEKATASTRAVVPIPELTAEHLLDNASYFFSLESEEQYGTNQNGTCTHIACAIMLGYYDYYVNNDTVDSSFHYMENGERKPGTTEAFHLYLQEYLGTTSCGIQQAATGLNTYMLSRLLYWGTYDVEYVLNSYSTVFSKVSSEIEENRPAVIAMFQSYGASMNHSVTVYGYKETVSSTGNVTLTYYVQTGWGYPLRASYSHTWFADVLYLEEE